MYITVGVFNTILKQFEDIDLDKNDIFSSFNVTPDVLQEPLALLPSGIVGTYIERAINKSGCLSIGFEKGFIIPVTIAGIMYSLYQNCNSVKDIFDKADIYTPIVNPLYSYKNSVENNIFYHEIYLDSRFAKEYPLATRQLHECQIGLTLQILYTLTGKRIKPLKVYSMYAKENSNDKLSELVNFPIIYSKDRFALLFDKAILDLPILMANNQLLSTVEEIINSISPNNSNLAFSHSIREQLLQNMPLMDISLKIFARRMNIGERTLQRKLFKEGTSFQTILNEVRTELAKKYLEQDFRLVDIAYLLGFESQSAFNKFFKKQFKEQPTKYKK